MKLGMGRMALVVMASAMACSKGPGPGHSDSTPAPASGSAAPPSVAGSSSGGAGPAMGTAPPPAAGPSSSASSSSSGASTGLGASTDASGGSGDGASATGSSSAGDDASGAGSPVTGLPGRLDPEVSAIVASISSARIAQTMQTLAGFGTRSSCSTQTTGATGIVPARDWIKAQFDAIGGLTTSLFAFAQTGCSQALTRHDVLAVLPGTVHPERIVVVGGHYDSRTVNVMDGTSAAPGANDSGSQTALVLELARAFAGHRFDATLAFVAFAGEEEGLVGSKALAQDLSSIAANGQVVAMLNCDIVGGDNTANDAGALQQFRLYSPGTPREVGATTPDGTPDDTSPSRGLMRYVADWGAAYVPSMAILPKLREDRPGRGGDHESFIAAGSPGVRFIEPTENLAHEHTADDLYQYVTPDYTPRIAQVVASVAASLARAPASPGSIGGSGNAGAPSLTWVAPSTGAIDHYVVAARPVTENFYHARLSVDAAQTSLTTSPGALGVDASTAYFVSVAAVDAAGHESLFAYPEYRCDGSGCVVPAAALNITATN